MISIPGWTRPSTLKCYKCGTVFTHPLCLNTWRNGGFIGNEASAAGY